MIHRGRRLASRAGHENVSFVQAGIDSVPLEDDSTDVVLSNGAINLAARKSRVFAEARRIIRPGGRLSVSDLTIAEEELPSEILVHPSAWAG
jgi:ubiquinone/menaquinone biosynthesis C-methylase UbiE